MSGVKSFPQIEGMFATDDGALLVTNSFGTDLQWIAENKFDIFTSEIIC